MTSIVLPYTNPDLDGVACALALASLKSKCWSAYICGTVNIETNAVLTSIGLQVPPVLDNWDNIESIWLVDTHHPKQLPSDLPRHLVTQITDHHTGGTPDYFPNACIENELVGAAATLVTERYFRTTDIVPEPIAWLLQAAIISNTLNFNAPSTSPRDHGMFTALKNISPVSKKVKDAMKQAKASELNYPTTDIIESDLKRFSTKQGDVIISQIEAASALDLLERPDVDACLDKLVEKHGVSSAVLILVDLDRCGSAIKCTSRENARKLSRALEQRIDGNGVIRLARLVQRKSDVVPKLLDD